jgi:hypothetical protein
MNALTGKRIAVPPEFIENMEEIYSMLKQGRVTPAREALALTILPSLRTDDSTRRNPRRRIRPRRR